MSLNTITGFSLIEVLISLLLLSFALLGLAAIELTTLRDSQNNYYFSQAVTQLQSFSDRLRIWAPRGDIQQQFEQWNQENQQVLPQGVGTLGGHFPTYTVSVFWGEWKQYTCSTLQRGERGCITESIQLTA